jgi:L-2,4-diaminobutyric acid acetyltransferase
VIRGAVGHLHQERAGSLANARIKGVWPTCCCGNSLEAVAARFPADCTETVPAEKLIRQECSHNSALELRRVVPSDAQAIWNLVRETEFLDTNSRYAYLILCDHFRDTCFVAEIDGRLAGFVTAYVPPNRPHAIFVWQIAVADWAQKKGIAGKLLTHLVASVAGRGITHLEATVTPSNLASRQLFTALAKRIGASITSQEHYSPTDLGDPTHEAEHLFQIGPLPTNCNFIEE